MTLNIDISSFIEQHRLPSRFQQHAERWFFPLAENIVMHQSGANRPLLVGVNGAQGSGKSTLSDLLVHLFEHHYKLHAVALSIDDFYLTRKERSSLSENTHPLLITRGVPGTHDTALAIQVIKDLIAKKLPVAIPRFNKATDDRYAESDIIEEPVDIIILEGWCVGSEPQLDSELLVPVNALEAEQDKEGVWRQYVNEQLTRQYQQLFSMVDIWVMFKAPNFDCVYQWRLEQEEKLRAKVGDKQHVMSPEQVAMFIQYYQRITEHTLLTLPSKAHFIYHLDQYRQITQLSSKPVKLSTMQATKWLIFTDMDGTLLDHRSYSFEPAKATLNKLAKYAIPVIPITSKTQAELEKLREDLDNTHPFIIENGAAVLIPKGYFHSQPAGTMEQGLYWVKAFVEPRTQWQALIEKIKPDYPNQFITFAEAGIAGIIEMTGLAPTAAELAAKRQYGEPLKWLGDEKSKQAFITTMKAHGANVLEGGRFIHISGQSDKGRALKWLASVYQQQAPNQAVSTIALGDSQNDVAMLEVADYAVVIRSPSHDAPSLQRQTGLLLTKAEGPAGWAEAITSLIDEI